MATLILGAAGTLLGGPIGGAVGALLGQQVDRTIIGSPHRDGPRLQDLKVTTSSYGSAIARQHGRMRAAGTIIWATDLQESSDTAGGGKGQPSVTTYSYSVSFAVALSSRPIVGVGRVWADGNLLRGAAGDLKTGGTLRIYNGYGDQPVDPLIASDRGADCPAFRHTAYAVFEDLQLADFGNRIPALTFEIVADEGPITLADLMACSPEPVTTERALPALQGFSFEGGPLSRLLSAIDAVYPLALDAGGERLSITAADAVPAEPPLLPPPAAAQDDQSFAPRSGATRQRAPGETDIPDALRYYDVDRDFQAGLQRADGRARPGHGRTIEFPGALAADDARGLIDAAAVRAGGQRDTFAWRVTELDPALVPGRIVHLPGQPGNWRITGWEWRDQGVELELLRLPRGPARQPSADPGAGLGATDLPPTPTALQAFELPWDGMGPGDRPAIFAAAGSTGAGWGGAALYADHGGELIPLGGSGARRSITGALASALPPSSALRLEGGASVTVQLLSGDFALGSTDAGGIANGANRALVGAEVIQFASAEALGSGSWRLGGLLRGRGGTEGSARGGHPAGAPFVLLDATPINLDPVRVGPSQAVSIVAIARGDTSPIRSPVANAGLTLRPLVPVHPRVAPLADGGCLLSWARRARGTWNWRDEVDVPLNEEAERYRVGLGPTDSPMLTWEVTDPSLAIAAAAWAELRSDHAGLPMWVRQIGTFALSDPLLLTILS